MKAPIAIVFVNLKGNLGDFAILHAMLIELRSRFPGRPLHVFSHGFRDVDEQRLAAFRASSTPEFEHIGTTYFKKSNVTLKQFFTLIGIWPLVQARLITSLAASCAASASRFRDYEAIFLAGGDQWGGTADVGISTFATLNAIYRQNQKIYAFPFSVNRKMFMLNSINNLQCYFDKIRGPLVARDETTNASLDQLGLTSISGMDCVFSLDDLAKNIEPTVRRERSSILIVLTGGAKTLESDLRTALRRLGSLTSRLGLLTTCAPEDGKIYEHLSSAFDLPFYAPMTWQEAVAEIKATSLVVTNRLHGLIFSSLAGTAVLPVKDRKKAEAFARDAQIPYSAASISSLTSGLLEQCVMNRDDILQSMVRYRSRACRTNWSPVEENGGCVGDNVRLSREGGEPAWRRKRGDS